MGLLHACMLNTIPHVQVVAICDKSKLISKFAKKAFRSIAIVNELEALTDFDLNVAYVTTPIPSHSKIIENIYSASISPNIFVEKTLASAYGDASKICTLAKNSNGVNMVGYERRYAVTFKKAFELMGQKAMGELVSFKTYAYSSDFLTLNNERAQQAASSRGGLLRDLCSHAIDLSVWFFDELEVVSSKHEYRRSTDFIESQMLTVTSKNGYQGCIEASWCKEGYRMPEVGIEINGTNGTITANDDQVQLTNRNITKKWYRLDLKDNVDFLLATPEYYRENRQFIDCIAQGKQPDPSFLTALKTEKVIDQAQRI
jgi:predicted dehydrogenase